MVIHHDPFIPPEILLIGLAILDGVPKFIVSVQAFSDLSLGGRLNVGDLESIVYFFEMDSHHLGLAQVCHQFFEEILVTTPNGRYLSGLFVVFFLLALDCLDESGRNG